MIQAHSKTLHTIFIFWLLLSGSFFLQAQPDTIVVYEYIYKHDTVWIESEPVRDTLVIEQLSAIDCATLYIDSRQEKAGLVIFSGGATATIPIHRIIIGENEIISGMRKKGFFTMFMLAIQSVLPAQTTVDFYTGTTSHWFQHNVSTISNPMGLGAHMGAAINLPLKNPKWAISLGLEGHFVFPVSEYRQTRAIDQTLPYLERDFAQIQTNAIINELNTGLFGKPFKMYTLPLKLSFNTGQWKPYFGMAYSFTDFIYDPHIDNNYSNQPTSFHDFSLLTGTRYAFTNKIGVDFSISKGFAKKSNAYEDFISPTAGIPEYGFQSVYATFSLVFTL
jgi:hypothetical protein